MVFDTSSKSFTVHHINFTTDTIVCCNGATYHIEYWLKDILLNYDQLYGEIYHDKENRAILTFKNITFIRCEINPKTKLMERNWIQDYQRSI